MSSAPTGLDSFALSLDDVPEKLLRAVRIGLGLAGVFALILGGIIMLRNLAASTAVLLIIMTIVVGISWIIDGVMALVDSGNAPSRGWAIALGIISVIAGIAVVAMPAWTAWMFVTFAAIMMIVLGVIGIVRAFRLRKPEAA